VGVLQAIGERNIVCLCFGWARRAVAFLLTCCYHFRCQFCEVPGEKQGARAVVEYSVCACFLRLSMYFKYIFDTSVISSQG